jgi:hypothetical protein
MNGVPSLIAKHWPRKIDSLVSTSLQESVGKLVSADLRAISVSRW